MARHSHPEARTPVAEPKHTPAPTPPAPEPTPEREPVTAPAPNKAEPDKAIDDVTAPGEAAAGEEVGEFKASGSFLVFDPFTLDSVGEKGGKMRVTEFVRTKLAEGKLVKA